MAAVLHLDLPRTRRAPHGFAQPCVVEVSEE
jgi:hypothetical protein